MINGDVFRGCTNRISWNVGVRGSYDDIPMAQANSGEANDFAELGNVPAVCISGNAGSQADYTLLRESMFASWGRGTP